MITIKEVQGLLPAQKLEIMRMLYQAFRATVNARSAQVDGNYERWQKNYDAIPKQRVRSQPFNGASNFIPQLIRMHTDILSARVVGIIQATRPLWKPNTFRQDVPADAMLALAQWLQWKSLGALKLPERLDQLVHSCFKSGTQVLKDRFADDVKYVVTGSADGQITESAVKESEMRLDVLAFEDFFPYPLTALTLEEVEIKFHRLRMTKDAVQQRKASKLWDEKACDLLLQGPSAVGASTQQQQAQQTQGIQLTSDVGRPFTAIEAHFDYELKPGKRFPLVAAFNPNSESIEGLLRLYHQPGSNPHDSCFTDFRLFPTDKSFYCACVPSILEDSQEEQAQIHNGRRDSSRIANVPAWKKKRYADVASPSAEWYPGKVFEVDNMDDLVPLVFGANYNSMVEEENFLLQLAERYTGVTPASQGQGAGVNGKRGSYASQGTMAMLAEANRRLDTYIKRVRLPMHHLGSRIYTSYRDFGDMDDFAKWGGNAQLVEALFKSESLLAGNGTFFDISATDAGANREADRSGLLLMANTMSAYYHEIVQVIQMVAGAPDGSPVKELMLQIADGARDLANRLLFYFDIDSRNKLLPDLRAVLGGGPQAQGGPQQAPAGTTASSLPESQGPVSPDDIQRLSGQLSQLAGGAPQGRPQ